MDVFSIDIQFGKTVLILENSFSETNHFNNFWVCHSPELVLLLEEQNTACHELKAKKQQVLKVAMPFPVWVDC
jgi:hypothetical protein